MEGIAVAVERGELDAVVGEHRQVLLPRCFALEQLLDWDVRGADEPAGVDLDAVQPQVAQDRQRLLEGLVVQAGGVGT